MQDFKQVGVSTLVDMLAHHTARYMIIVSEGGSVEEYNTCKMIVHFLQKEIVIRQKALTNSKNSSPEIVVKIDFKVD